MKEEQSKVVDNTKDIVKNEVSVIDESSIKEDPLAHVAEVPMEDAVITEPVDDGKADAFGTSAADNLVVDDKFEAITEVADSIPSSEPVASEKMESESLAENIPETVELKISEIVDNVIETTEISERIIEATETETLETTIHEEIEATDDGNEVIEPVVETTAEVTEEPVADVPTITEAITTESNDVVMGESVSDEVPVPVNVAIPAAIPEETKVARKGRKPTMKTIKAPAVKSAFKSPAKSPAKASAKSPVKATVTKRPYTRKIKPITPVDAGEEVSILSSSESAGSSKESINIMSSSNSDDSVPSLPSVDSVNSVSVRSNRSNRSVESEESATSVKSDKSKNSTATAKSAKTDNSEKISSSDKSIAHDSSDSIPSINFETEVPAWEKAACPAIFEKTRLKNPENRYKALKTRMEYNIKKNPEISLEELVRKFNDFNAKAVEQVYNILKGEKEVEKDDTVPVKKVKAAGKTSKKQQEERETIESKKSEDLELLKKLSLTSSGRKRRIRTEEGDWIGTNEIEGRVISHEPAQPPKEKRKKRILKKSIEDEDLNATEDPFRLILLHEFDDQNRIVSPGQVDENGEEFELVKAPFRVEICNSVILLMDLHSHLHSSEIIGLLGGVFIKTEETSSGSLPVLRINYVFPCSTAHSTGTQVDVDPLSEMEAGDYFESNGVRMAGWYHSHPNFEPNPSLRDLETQTMYQGLFKNIEPDSNIEPFVGVIVNPYMAMTESSSHVECFYVVPTVDPTQERLPYRLPLERTSFDPQIFPQILEKMREIIFKAESSNDRLDMRKNAQPGVKRIEKLLTSLKSHGNLSEDQMEQIKILFN